MNAQTIIIILLSLIVFKLYPEAWGVILILTGAYIALLIARSILSKAKKTTIDTIKSFSIQKTVDYVIGLFFCFAVIFSAAFIPTNIAARLGASVETSLTLSTICLLASLSFLAWRLLRK